MNKTPEEAVKSFAELAEYAEQKKIVLSGAISTSFGCSIDGIVSIRTSGQYYFSAAKIRNFRKYHCQIRRGWLILCKFMSMEFI